MVFPQKVSILVVSCVDDFAVVFRQILIYRLLVKGARFPVHRNDEGFETQRFNIIPIMLCDVSGYLINPVIRLQHRLEFLQLTEDFIQLLNTGNPRIFHHLEKFILQYVPIKPQF